jgi:exodeoxyribonuclease VII small subunit
MKEQGNKKEKSFEASLERLEKIVEEMAEQELKLEAMLKKLEEGMSLVEFCSRKLEEAEKKVEMITKKANGTIETQEFPSSEEARPGDEGPEESLLAEEESPQGQIEQEEQPLF